jgi:hypothetical protein
MVVRKINEKCQAEDAFFIRYDEKKKMMKHAKRRMRRNGGADDK